MSVNPSFMPLCASLLGQESDSLKTNKSSVDELTGEALSNSNHPILKQALQSAQDGLKGLTKDADFNAKMNRAFGNGWDAEVFSNLVQEFAKGNFSQLPAIEILPSAAINGANGAFASVTNTIYLAKEFVEQNAGNPGAITSVVLEEMGHFIDSKINVSDAAGDEGDIFARVVQGKAISAGELQNLKSENDHATINLDGENIQIEQAKSFAAGDRVIDIIRQERGSWVNGSRDAEVLLSKGDWTFNQPTGLPNMDMMNGDFVNLIAGDFDGNGLTDFIRQEKGSWVNGVNDAQVYLGAGNGTFKSPIQMTDMAAMNGNLVNLVAGDFNGDKYTDIIRQEKGSWVDGYRDAEIYLSNGNGTFKNPILMNNASAMNGNYVNLIVGDFTGGGADDIIRQEKGSWVDGNNDVQYYTFSQGNFKFQANVPDMGMMNGNFVNLVAGDFNGDRVTDLIRQEKGSWVDGNRDAEIYISNGSWGFKSRTLMNNASGMNGDNVNLIVGDLTGGGADDIIRQEKNGWVDGKNDVEFLTYSNSNFVKVKDVPNMSELNGNYVTLVPGLFGLSSNTTPPNPGGGSYYKELSSWNDGTWDQQTGDNDKFDGLGNDESDSRVKQIYTDLSTALFGRKNTFTAGYVFDSSYRNGVVINGFTGWAHSGIDIAAGSNEVVKAVVSGKIGKIYNEGNIGYAIGVDETDANGREVGRRWWYLHLAGSGNWKQGDSVTAGVSNFGVTLASQGHVHLTVQNANFEQKGYYNDTNQNVVLSRTMSPLQAYWQYRNQ